MREISRGNKQYELKVSGQFIDGIDKDIRGLKEAAVQGDWATVRKLAHNMKTTVSIMGLEAPILSLLDTLESADGEAAPYDPIIARLALLCGEAVDEVRRFRTTL